MDLILRESLLDLLMKQQTRGEQGVRLSFHQDLMSALAFNSWPYHYAAACGNVELACYLYLKGIKLDKSATVASFSAGGINGTTSWRKPITVSASETALLAGSSTAAKALKLMEKGIPLTWCASAHHKYPTEFKEKAKKVIGALLQSKWFYALPGPARIKVTSKVLDHIARTHVWNFVNKKVWDGKWQSVLGENLFKAVNLLKEMGEVERTNLAPVQPFPQYQFRVAQANPNDQRSRQIRGILKFLRRAFLGSGWWYLQKVQGHYTPLLSTIGVFVASGINPSLQISLPIILSLLCGSENVFQNHLRS